MSDPLGLINTNTSSRVNPLQLPIASKPSGAASETSFKDVLMKNIDQVNRLQQDAERAIEDLVSGKRDDVDGVLIAKQKADMAFKLLLQVRNKMVDAYEEIKQMRV